MKKSILALALAATTMGAATTIHAHEHSSSPHTITTNVGLFSNYVFRGMTYSNGDMALQGGVDYAHDSGLYAGIWATTLEEDENAGNSIEVDLYGGYYHQYNDDVAFDIGLLQFYYPDQKKKGMNGENIHTTELYFGAGWKWFTAKYSVTLTDWGGVNNKSMGMGKGDSKGTGYYELNFDYGLPWWDLNLSMHVGKQDVKNYSDFNYTDWGIGLSKDFSIGAAEGWTAGVNYTDTDADRNWWVGADGDNRGKGQVTAYIMRTF